ncbi:MAG: hypothetical protein PF638_09545 [Candidatus Delongbacteria bacterium]|jgi:hypothetical protein|nr:hypothetical protein [Candidatus Delongbacteria bacterium]
MKYVLICLILFTNLFSQFSSNVDYKELSRKKNSFGVSYNNSMAENDWKANFINIADTVKFTGSYDFSKNDLNLNGYYYLHEDRLTYSAGISRSSYSSVVTLDTLGSIERIDLGENALSDFYGKLGYVFGEDQYGGSIGLNFLSFDENKCNAATVNGFINGKSASGNKYGLDLTYSLITDDSLRYTVRSYDVVSPDLNFGVYYTFVNDTYDLKFYSGVSLYDAEVYENDSYIILGVSFQKGFKNMNSDLKVDLGTNITSEFKVPEIPLPYLYYSISLENKLFKEKINLKVGWKSEMYNAVIGSFDEISENIPEHYPAMFDLEEIMTKNKLYIELNYLY